MTAYVLIFVAGGLQSVAMQSFADRPSCENAMHHIQKYSRYLNVECVPFDLKGSEENESGKK